MNAYNKIGYARVSSTSQNLDSQMDALQKAGCLRIFCDKATADSSDRIEWNKLMDYLRPGDTLIITELSRMTRSLVHLLQVTKEFEAKQVQIISLRENIDTSTATGRCFLSIMGAVSQMERELKEERAAAGRVSAKARGKTGGRPRTDPEKLEQARITYENSDRTADQVCQPLGIGKRTLFYYMAQKKKEIAQKEAQNLQ